MDDAAAIRMLRRIQRSRKELTLANVARAMTEKPGQPSQADLANAASLMEGLRRRNVPEAMIGLR